MTPDVTSQEFFDDKYRRQGDPWDFASNPYEQQRYDAIYHALSHRHYPVAFEPGCSIGVLTARVAPLCGYLHALDISPTAVRQARQRCQALPNVEIRCGALPNGLPAEKLDLVLLSEIGYYFEPSALHQLGTTLVSCLNQDGTLLAAHWLGASEDHLLSGDTVHQILYPLDGLALQHSERHAGYRLDRWVRQG